MIDEKNCKSCQGDNINTLYLFSLSLFFFLFYRITSAIMVYIGTKNIGYSMGQFLFEHMLYRSIYVNYRLKCESPSSPQRWIQSMESMLEAFPQLILQMYYTIKIGELEWFVMISVVFSMLSMVNKAVSEDKALFWLKDWHDAKWTCKRFPCVNQLYLTRLLFRIFGISNRVLVIVYVWYEFGGLTLFIVAVIEFFILFLIVFKTKEFSFRVRCCTFEICVVHKIHILQLKFYTI